MRFDVDMALAVCGSLAGSEGVATVPVPRLSCLVTQLSLGGGCIIACTARVVWLFVKGGWAGLGRVGDTWMLWKGRGFCATAGWAVGRWNCGIVVSC